MASGSLARLGPNPLLIVLCIFSLASVLSARGFAKAHKRYGGTMHGSFSSLIIGIVVGIVVGRHSSTTSRHLQPMHLANTVLSQIHKPAAGREVLNSDVMHPALGPYDAGPLLLFQSHMMGGRQRGCGHPSQNPPGETPQEAGSTHCRSTGAHRSFGRPRTGHLHA